MGFITQILGEQQLENFKLAEETYSGSPISLSKEVKAQTPSVSFSELEQAYKSDAITFNAINKSVQMIMAGGFKEFDFKKKQVIKKYEEFFENIGFVGTDTTYEELLEGIFKDQMVYGNAFVEIIFNSNDTRIVDLALIDPKKIDYAKTSGNKIVLDERGSPVGYVIKLDTGSYAEGDPIPEKYDRLISLDAHEIFILAKRIAHFKLYVIGDKFYGIGLIEAAYRSGIYKKNIEKAQANSIYSRGFNPLIGYIGNERRMATPTDIKQYLEQIKTLDFQRYLALPNWVKVEPVQYEHSDFTTTALKDLRNDQIAALSAPQALVSGSGEATNRATLGDQRILWEFTLKDIIKKTMSYFRKYILRPINKYNGYGGVPEVKWGELRAEDIDMTSDKIIRLLTSKSVHFSPEFQIDLEEDLRKIMNIKKSGKKPKIIKEDNNGKSNDGVSNIQPPKPNNSKEPPKD